MDGALALKAIMTNPKEPRGWTSTTAFLAAGVALVAILAAPGIVVAQSTQARNYKVLHRFSGGADGALPIASLVRDAAGNLYGTALGGGSPRCFDGAGCGTVFKVDPTGKLSVLHRFTGGKNGAAPNGLIRDATGTLYGTTGGGGTGCGNSGCGTVFKLEMTGKETVLYRFSGAPDGAGPAGLIPDSAGNLYGTTYYGGTGPCNDGQGVGCGTVFKLDKSGNETILHSFSGGTDGANPPGGGLVRDSMGILYGTALNGGDFGQGIAFKLNKTGKVTVLHAFTDGTDGGQPQGGLIRDAAGNLYGTTFSGGNCQYNQNGCGTVFKLNKAGRETVLYDFLGGSSDGLFPFAGVIQDAVGNLYGTTHVGGDPTCVPDGCGVVFKLDTKGKETIVRSFKSGKDGAFPQAGVISDEAGNLYGTTTAGGGIGCRGAGCGIVFKITP